jgi:hypothetical protein
MGTRGNGDPRWVPVSSASEGGSERMSPQDGPLSLDRALQAARDADVRPDVVRREIEGAIRRVAVTASQSGWAGTRFRLASLILCAAAITGVAVAVHFTDVSLAPQIPRAEAPPVQPEGSLSVPLVKMGTRVAVAVKAGARYAVQTREERTRIDVEAGAITVRLFEGATPHLLQVATEGLLAEATGTIYEVGLSSAGPYVSVQQGSVRVRTAQSEYHLSAGERWLGGKTFPSTHTVYGGQELLGMARPTSTEVSAIKPSPRSMEPSLLSEIGVPDAGAHESSEESVVDTWRRARLLRGQAKYTEAIELLKLLSDADESTWSALAQAELTRLYNGVLGQPDAAAQSARRFLERYPNHTLKPEIEHLLCSSLKQTNSPSSGCER